MPSEPESGTENDTPFIHKFRTDKFHYIYDINSNRVFQVNRQVHELADRPDLRSPELICGHFPEFDADEASAAINELDEAAEKGWLSTHRPRTLAYRPGTTLQDMLDSSPYEQLILNVTESCNLRCSYCIYSGNYEGQRTHSDRVMTFDTAREALDRFMEQAIATVHISFYGGEPLSRFDLIEQVIEYTQRSYPDKKVHWTLTTNAVMMTERIAHYLMEQKVLLTVSLDGPQAVNDRHRKDASGHGVFTRVMRSLEMLRHADPKTYDETLQFSVVCAPPFDFEETERFFNEHELTRNHRYSFSYMNSTTENPELKPSNDNIERLNGELAVCRKHYLDGLIETGPDGEETIDFARSLYEKDFSDFYHRSKTPLGDEMYPNGCCIPGARRLFVSTDGCLHVCEKLDNVYPIGTVGTWVDREKIERMYEEYLAMSRDCTSCWACRLCSLCFFNFIARGAFSAEHRASECRYVRRRWDRVLRDYFTLLEKDEHLFDHLAELRRT